MGLVNYWITENLIRGNMNKLLEIKDLKIQYNGQDETIEVLHGISLNLEEGKAIGIVGESGSGKSQTALAVLQLIEGRPGIVNGSIRFREKDLSNAKHAELKNIRGHELAIIFQDAKASLIPYLTIREQVMDTHKSLANGRSKEELLSFAQELLNDMNFNDPDRVLESYPNQLSGGECQRAYVMLTLLGNPSILVADEPTSSLDPITSAQIVELIKQICKKLNISLILISHDLGEIAKVTDHIYVFYNGHIVEEFPTEWVKEYSTKEPKHPYSRFLFSMFKGKAFKELRNGAVSNSSELTDVIKKNEELCGCIYSGRCPLKNDLPEAIKHKCETIHPDLSNGNGEGKVACWGVD